MPKNRPSISPHVVRAMSGTPLARRRPWKVAREAVALDQLSQGRFVLGVVNSFDPVQLNFFNWPPV